MNDPVLLLGDCLDRMSDIEDGSVDMVLADPPYGTTACKWDAVIPLEPMWQHLKRVIKPNGAIVMTASQPFTSFLILSNPSMFKHEWVWRKEKAGNFAVAKFCPLKVHENVVVFCKGRTNYYPIKTPRDKPIMRGESTRKGVDKNSNSSTPFGKHTRKLFTDRFPQSILTFGTVRKTLHPTQKPVALMEYLIKTYTNEGETVLDFTMGSGTTGVACVNTGRRFIGIERDDKYFQIALDRINAAKLERGQP